MVFVCTLQALPVWLKVATEIGTVNAAFSYQVIPNKVVGSDTKIPF